MCTDRKTWRLFLITMYDCHQSELSPGKNLGLNLGNLWLQFFVLRCALILCISTTSPQKQPAPQEQLPNSEDEDSVSRSELGWHHTWHLLHRTDSLWRKYVPPSTQWVELTPCVQLLPLVSWSRLYRNMYGTSIEGTYSSLQFTPSLLAIPLVDKTSHAWIPHPTPSPYTFWEEKE